jgi:Peptidoglycan-synthase activator LpoB
MEQLMKLLISSAVLAAALVAGGCGGGPRYEDNRPPVDATVDGNTGLQAKDVGSATDHMAGDLLALPELNAADKKWTIVLTGVTNNTADPSFSHYDVFSDRLRPLLLSKGHGRVALIENKAQYHAVQNQELEQPADNLGQGGGGSANPPGIQPDYGLTIKIDEMPNRATSYFLVTASLTDLRTRQVVWSNYPPYEIQTAR